MFCKCFRQIAQIARIDQNLISLGDKTITSFQSFFLLSTFLFRHRIYYTAGGFQIHFMRGRCHYTHSIGRRTELETAFGFVDILQPLIEFYFENFSKCSHINADLPGVPGGVLKWRQTCRGDRIKQLCLKKYGSNSNGSTHYELDISNRLSKHEKYRLFLINAPKIHSNLHPFLSESKKILNKLEIKDFWESESVDFRFFSRKLKIFRFPNIFGIFFLDSDKKSLGLTFRRDTYFGIRFELL